MIAVGIVGKLYASSDNIQHEKEKVVWDRARKKKHISMKAPFSLE
jgi:hypothetical protein